MLPALAPSRLTEQKFPLALFHVLSYSQAHIPSSQAHIPLRSRMHDGYGQEGVRVGATAEVRGEAPGRAAGR